MKKLQPESDRVDSGSFLNATMDPAKEYFACLALRNIPRFKPELRDLVIRHYDSAYAALQNARSWTRFEEIGNAVVRSAITEKWREKAEEEYRAAVKAGMGVLTFYDDRYPQRLREIADPPLILYYVGDCTLLMNPGVGVVGARDCTKAGLDGAGRISAQLSQIGITVISGLALGIDGCAHMGGLSGLGSSIAVLGCGLDINYPMRNAHIRKELEEKGLVVTEYGPGTPAHAHHFPHRNRIISGISLGVLVAEAAHNSGSLITARLAGEQGREVFALPGPLGQPTFTGCHRLIKQGAALVESAADILEVLRYDFARELEGIEEPEEWAEVDLPEDAPVAKKQSKAKREKVAAEPEQTSPVESVVRKRPSVVNRASLNLNEDELQVLSLLDAADKVHIDVLGRDLGWDTAKISRTLILLEMRGAVQQLPGMWYLAREA